MTKPNTVCAAPLLDALCPPAVRALLVLFSAAGEGAYLVGGCVRDALMGRTPHDWDVAVTTIPARTEEVCAAACLRTIPTGAAHGTVTVLVPADFGSDAEIDGNTGEVASYAVECTTCRTENGYSDGRHPDAVVFTGRLSDDLSRRDFTVNAMAATPESDGRFAVTDLYGGRDDLRARVIRCVGDPDTRLTEDALRVLRGVRFCVKLGFAAEPTTAAAMTRCAAGLARISRERVRAELEGILTSPDPDRGVRMLAETGLVPYVFPGGLSPYAKTVTAERGLSRLRGFAPRLAALMWGLDKNSQAENLCSLRLANGVRREAETILSFAGRPYAVSRRYARRLRREYGKVAAEVLTVCRAVTPRAEKASHAGLTRLIGYVRASEAAGDCVSVAELALKGAELSSLGVRPGPDTGHMLSLLLDAVLDRPSANTKDALAILVRQRVG